MQVQNLFAAVRDGRFTGTVVWMWLVAALALALIPVMWRHRNRTGGGALILLLIAAAVWNVFSGMEYLSFTAENKIFWMRLTYLGVSLTPTSSLLIGRIFCGDDHRLHRVFKIVLVVMPLLTMIFALTNPAHGLLWSSMAPDPFNSGMVWTFGPWFHVWALYSYLAFAATMFMVVRAIVLQRGIYRVQAIGMLVSLLPPWLANLIFMFNIEMNGLNTYYITPLAAGISAVMLAINRWVFYRLTQVPVARDQVLESMNQGVLVLNDQFVILDANPALCKLMHVDRRSTLGKNLTRDFPVFAPHITPIIDAKGERRHEIFVDNIGCLDIHISPLQRRGKSQPGWVVLIDDISERKLAERVLEGAHYQLKLKVDALMQAQSTIKTLGELVPICAWCGTRIQQEDGSWINVDKFIEGHSHAEMTHGICPSCVDKL